MTFERMVTKMFKKILVGTVLVGLIGILVTGAINRTNATSGSAEGRGQGRGNGNTAMTYTAGRGQGGSNGNTATTYTAGRGQGGSSWGQRSESATGDQLGVGQAQVTEWLTLEGTVVSVDENALVVETSAGEQVVIENRPWLFAQEQGFLAQAGDEVTLTGFYEGDAFEVGQISDTTNGKTVSLRDQDGRPGWAGRGRRGG
jgi:hypothetical protein